MAKKKAKPAKAKKPASKIKRGAKKDAAGRPASTPRKKKVLPSTYFHAGFYARKRACVLGLGRSGMAVAKLLSKKGFKVFVSDTRPHKDIRSEADKLPAGVQWEGKGHSDRVLNCHFAVKSPGIPSHAPILKKFADAGIPVFSELEVAVAFCASRDIVAVTGTNGKTTSVHMAASVFKAARRRPHVYGNVGEPLSAGVLKIKAKDTVILEVSSYQLEDSRWFRPQAGLILNLTTDHIDHHGSLNAYKAAKARIFMHQDRSQTCVFNADDALVFPLARDCKARKLFFGRAPSTRVSCWLENGKIRLRLPGEKKPQTVFPPKLPGDHNLENAMGVALLAASRGVSAAAINKGFKAFTGVEHRIEDLGRRGILRCVNDSKATNVDSTLACLRSLTPDESGKVLLILGGLGKGGGFGALRPLVERYAKAVLAIGAAGPKVESDLQGATHVFPCGDLATAVKVAYQIGQKGETLLLSPACASFDQFANFEERGRRFKELTAAAGKAR